ncbi:N-acetylgalactosamine-6-sulfatase [Oceaniferula spumae]|uniref:N-acetylgalactosamine-6-sulfatase n=1 Tax=Oceaniferula spumae TaxID=2979115 RepID=A0AAT9FI03_9BACT
MTSIQALLSVTWLVILSVGAQAASKPNIILVMADDQGWGDTGYNGHPVVKTPNLDAMAKNAMVFNRFYAGAPVCSPTRGTVLTGRNNNRINILDHGWFMRDQEYTIAQALKAEGYVTGHFGKWHVGSVQAGSGSNPSARGFDQWLSAPNFFDTNPYLSRQGKVEQMKGDSSTIVIDETIKFLKQHKDSGKPMFAVAWYSSPHSPHQEKPSSGKMYQGVKGAPFFNEITALDETLGRLRKQLREMDLHQNTILWYCSDNGGLMTESSGGRGKKGDIYEGGLRVPALIEWPAAIKPGTTEIPAVTSDIYPTLLSLIGSKQKPKRPLDGIDLREAIVGDMHVRKTGIGFWRHSAGGNATHSDRILKQIMKAQQAGKATPYPERIKGDQNIKQHPLNSFPGHAAWLEWPLKLHRNENQKGKVGYELYNLEKDPMEKSNIAAQNPEDFDRLKLSLKSWQESVIRSLNGGDYQSHIE